MICVFIGAWVYTHGSFFLTLKQKYMCLRTKERNITDFIPDINDVQAGILAEKLLEAEQLTAEEDITVFKLLIKKFTEDRYYSPVMYSEYTPGTYTSEFRCIAGTHSGFICYLSISKGLHSYRAPLSSFKGNTWVKMVIPKGSKYFVSGDGKELVSDTLVWDGNIYQNYHYES